LPWLTALLASTNRNPPSSSWEHSCLGSMHATFDSCLEARTC
jgi:hypothetical protein